MATGPFRRSGILLLAVGAVLLAGLIVVIVLGARPLAVEHDAPASPSATPSATSSFPPPSDAVDASVSQRGWVPEPITRDPEAYARAALEAAGTFDTRLTTRDEWLSWLETWFTPSPLYENAQDALDQMADYKAELDQAVVQPQNSWDDLASEDGRVTARVSGNVVYLELPETTANRMWTASADLVLTYTRSAEGGEVTYDETVRVSVQVVCDGVSLPTPDSAQQAGDCKVVRYFDEAVG